MTDRILQILDNVRYWETCPEDYKKDIETFLESQKQDLRIHDVVGRSEQLKAFVDEFIEAWEDGNGGDSYLYRKAKSL